MPSSRPDFRSGSGSAGTLVRPKPSEILAGPSLCVRRPLTRCLVLNQFACESEGELFTWTGFGQNITEREEAVGPNGFRPLIAREDNHETYFLARGVCSGVIAR